MFNIPYFVVFDNDIDSNHHDKSEKNKILNSKILKFCFEDSILDDFDIETPIGGNKHFFAYYYDLEQAIRESNSFSLLPDSLQEKIINRKSKPKTHIQIIEEFRENKWQIPSQIESMIKNIKEFMKE